MSQKTTILPGSFHTVPKDVRAVLLENNTLRELWNTLTPLARNEWICWITFFKKPTTRENHIVRMSENLQKGKRRPCCWAGCPHRKSSGT